MNTGEIIQKWVITKKSGLYKNERVKVPLLYIVIIINFFFTKITKFTYNFTGLLLSAVNKKHC